MIGNLPVPLLAHDDLRQHGQLDNDGNALEVVLRRKIALNVPDLVLFLCEEVVKVVLFLVFATLSQFLPPCFSQALKVAKYQLLVNLQISWQTCLLRAFIVIN